MKEGTKVKLIVSILWVELWVYEYVKSILKSYKLLSGPSRIEENE